MDVHELHYRRSLDAAMIPLDKARRLIAMYGKEEALRVARRDRHTNPELWDQIIMWMERQ